MRNCSLDRCDPYYIFASFLRRLLHRLCNITSLRSTNANASFAIAQHNRRTKAKTLSALGYAGNARQVNQPGIKLLLFLGTAAHRPSSSAAPRSSYASIGAIRLYCVVGWFFHFIFLSLKFDFLSRKIVRPCEDFPPTP